MSALHLLLFQSEQWIQSNVLCTDLQIAADVFHDYHVIKLLAVELCNAMAEMGIRLDVAFANSCHSLAHDRSVACKGIPTLGR